MTAFNPSQIPTTGINAVTTLEQLLVWATYAFHNINDTVTAIEGDGNPAKVASVSDFYVPNNNTHRIIGRISIPISNDFAYNGKKVWASATEVSQTVIPSIFSSVA